MSALRSLRNRESSLVRIGVVFFLFLASGLALAIPSSKLPNQQTAWWTAQREVRRLVASEDQEQIYAMSPPPVRFIHEKVRTCRYCSGLAYLGMFYPETGKVDVVLTGDAREDWSTLVHEDIHSIMWRGQFGPGAQWRVQQWVEDEWAARSR